MKLHMLSERRAAVPTNLFHGSEASPASFNQGLIPKPPIKHGRGAGPEAIFLTPHLKLALYYGHTIIEVTANFRSNQLLADEEDFPLGEIPNTPEHDASSKEEWSKFWVQFDRFVSPPNKADKKSFYDAFLRVYKRSVDELQDNDRLIIDQWDDELLDAVRRIIRRRSLKGSGNTSMLMLDRPLAFHGRHKIIGIYKFVASGSKMRCAQVYYSNGGTIELGSVSEVARDWALY